MQVTDEMVEAGLRITLSSVNLPAGECMHETDVQEILSAALSAIVEEQQVAALAVQTQQGVEVSDVLDWVDYQRKTCEQEAKDQGYAAHERKIWRDKADWFSRIRSALVDVPAVESEPVCTVALIGAAGHRFLVPHPLDALDSLPVGTKLFAHPPRSLSNEGSEIERALEFVARWAWREDPPAAARNLSDRERLSAIKHHPTIKARAALSTRKGSSEGDGSATITKGHADE